VTKTCPSGLSQPAWCDRPDGDALNNAERGGNEVEAAVETGAVAHDVLDIVKVVAEEDATHVVHEIYHGPGFLHPP
jgi:hypothetical protein